MQRRPGEYSDPLHEPAQLTEEQVRHAPAYGQGDTVTINMQFTWPVENYVNVYVHFNFHEAEEEPKRHWGRKPPAKSSVHRPLVHGSAYYVEPDKEGTLDASVKIEIPEDAHPGLYSTIRASLGEIEIYTRYDSIGRRIGADSMALDKQTVELEEPLALLIELREDEDKRPNPTAGRARFS